MPTDLPAPLALGRRVARHGLAEPVVAERLVEQVAAMCGAHAQIMAAAELSIGLRVAGITRQDVRRALWEDRTLVKVAGPRGTIHLLPAADLPWWTGALGTEPPPNTQAPSVRLDEAQTDEVVAAIGDALLDRELTVDELGEEVVARTGPWAGERVLPAFQEDRPRWQQAIQVAAWRGVLCFGRNRGRRITHTNPATWLDGFAPAPPDPSAATLLLAYLRGYGPATRAEVVRWLNVAPAWVDRAVAAAGDRVETVGFEGATALAVAGDDEDLGPPRGVRLLPYFDAYAVGSHPRTLVFPGVASERALMKGQAGPYPVLLVDGVVAGVWHQRRRGKALAITVEPFGRLTKVQTRELEGQAGLVGEVLEATPELTIGEVTATPHL